MYLSKNPQNLKKQLEIFWNNYSYGEAKKILKNKKETKFVDSVSAKIHSITYEYTVRETTYIDSSLVKEDLFYITQTEDYKLEKLNREKCYSQIRINKEIKKQIPSDAILTRVTILDENGKKYDITMGKHIGVI